MFIDTISTNKITNIATSAATSGAISLDISNKNVYSIELNGNITSFTVTGWIEPGSLHEFVLFLKNDSVARTVSWDFVDDWHTSDGNSPSIDTADEWFTLFFWSYDGGNTVHGYCSKQ